MVTPSTYITSLMDERTNIPEGKKIQKIKMLNRFNDDGKKRERKKKLIAASEREKERESESRE